MKNFKELLSMFTDKGSKDEALPVAKLTEKELDAWGHQVRIIGEQTRILSMLHSSYRTLVATLRIKYSIPEVAEIEIDKANGEIHIIDATAPISKEQA